MIRKRDTYLSKYFSVSRPGAAAATSIDRTQLADAPPVALLSDLHCSVDLRSVTTRRAPPFG